MKTISPLKRTAFIKAAKPLVKWMAENAESRDQAIVNCCAAGIVFEDKTTVVYHKVPYALLKKPLNFEPKKVPVFFTNDKTLSRAQLKKISKDNWCVYMRPPLGDTCLNVDADSVGLHSAEYWRTVK